jgi:aminoglycoside 2'-N-acetyltransferase I
MPIKLHKAADQTTDETAALRELNAAVYPPEIVADWPGRSIEWASSQWRIIYWDEDGKALCHVGIVLRTGLINERPVEIGGIGGVMTHPNVRSQGLASKAINLAVEFFLEQRTDFGLLVCETKLVPFYERLHWRCYGDELIVTQHGKKSVFTFNRPMIHPVCTDGPSVGAIDLQGPPW